MMMKYYLSVYSLFCRIAILHVKHIGKVHFVNHGRPQYVNVNASPSTLNATIPNKLVASVRIRAFLRICYEWDPVQ